MVSQGLSCANLLLSSCANIYKDINTKVNTMAHQTVHLVSLCDWIQSLPDMPGELGTSPWGLSFQKDKPHLMLSTSCQPVGH